MYTPPIQLEVSSIIVPIDPNGNLAFDLIHPSFRPQNGTRFVILGGYEAANNTGHPIKGTLWKHNSSEMFEAYNMAMDLSVTARRMIALLNVQGFEVPGYLKTNPDSSFMVDTANPTNPDATNRVPYRELNPRTRFYMQQPIGSCYPGSLDYVVLTIGLMP